MTPFCISITGADDDVSIEELIALSRAYPFVEWGILLFPGKEGTPHNPTAEWRRRLTLQCRKHNMRCAVHLCGDDTFQALLSHRHENAFFRELQQFDRVQVNINGRERTFGTTEVVDVYRSLWAFDLPLILQCHAGSIDAVGQFLSGLAQTSTHLLQRVSVLFDTSCGRGKALEAWPSPIRVGDTPIDTGWAGGISAENIDSVLDAAEVAMRSGTIKARRYWLDMQSGVRTGTRFDPGKVERVLSTVAKRLR